MTASPTFVAQHRDTIVEFCRRHHVKRLDLFGSALAPAFDPGQSDLDFLVEFEPLPPVQHADAYLGLLEDLERLFGLRIDLVEHGAAVNPYFLRDMESHRQPLYAT